MIHSSRLKLLNRKQERDLTVVVYWMQASQRTECNHALEYAIRCANERRKPLVVYFGLTERYPEANQRHYAFMLQGLKEVKESLRERGIQMIVRHESPEVGVLELSKKASLIIVDRGYTRIQKRWRRMAAEKLDCPLIQVESDVIVPVEEVSPKEEYSAATIRPKMKKMAEYLQALKETQVRKDSLGFRFDAFDIDDNKKALKALGIDRNVQEVDFFLGGTSQAKKRLADFITDKLAHYPDMKNDPTADMVSHMSPYLHFGQISPLSIALKIMKHPGPGADAYLEELIVRRELSMNFVHYNMRYDDFEGLPDWCKKSLREHSKDSRGYIYDLAEFEKAQTHDPFWNAAQEEMVWTGKMHGYMRMYWGKKVIEWSQSPEEAFKTVLYLNNRYELDGRDPNGFAGVAWCFGKHDRPWAERPVFGKIRYMNAAGLKRKFDADKYVIKVRELKQKKKNHD